MHDYNSFQLELFFYYKLFNTPDINRQRDEYYQVNSNICNVSGISE